MIVTLSASTRLLAPMVLALALAQPAAAAPRLLAAQGTLVDEAGVGLEGTQVVKFTLYPDPDGLELPIWVEFSQVTFEEGRYVAVLGRLTPVEPLVLAEEDLYLGVALDLVNDLVPRPHLSALPFAALAERSRNQRGGSVTAGTLAADDLTAADVVAQDLHVGDLTAETTADALTVGSIHLDSDGVSANGAMVFGADGRFQIPPPVPPELVCVDGRIATWQSGAWRCASERDDVFAQSPAAEVAAARAADWTQASTAYDWGDHVGQGYFSVEEDPVFTSSLLEGISDSDVVEWNAVRFWVAAQSFATTTNLGSVEDPISATQVESWDAAYENLGGGDATYGGQDWDQAYAFASGFEEYVGGVGPAQAITDADLADWRALLDCRHFGPPPCEWGTAVGSSVIDLASLPEPDLHDPSSAPPLNAAAIERWNRSSAYTYQDPLSTCGEVLDLYPATPDGEYWLLDPSTKRLQKVYCDMVPGVDELGVADGSLGEGWMRIHRSDFDVGDSGWTGGVIEGMSDAHGCGRDPSEGADGAPDKVLGGASSFGAGGYQYVPADTATQTFSLLGRPHSDVRVKYSVVPVGLWGGQHVELRLDPGVHGFEFAPRVDTFNSSEGVVDCGGAYNVSIGRRTYEKTWSGHGFDAATIEFGSNLEWVYGYNYLTATTEWHRPQVYWKLDNVEVWIR